MLNYCAKCKRWFCVDCAKMENFDCQDNFVLVAAHLRSVMNVKNTNATNASLTVSSALNVRKLVVGIVSRSNILVIAVAFIFVLNLNAFMVNILPARVMQQVATASSVTIATRIEALMQ